MIYLTIINASLVKNKIKNQFWEIHIFTRFNLHILPRVCPFVMYEYTIWSIFLDSSCCHVILSSFLLYFQCWDKQMNGQTDRQHQDLQYASQTYFIGVQPRYCWRIIHRPRGRSDKEPWQPRGLALLRAGPAGDLPQPRGQPPLEALLPRAGWRLQRVAADLQPRHQARHASHVWQSMFDTDVKYSVKV